MEPISRTDIVKEPYSAAVPGRARGDPFSDSLKLAKADELLRDTGQYENWTRIRQKNDGRAAKTADLVLKRHALIADAGQAKAVDWALLDQLSAELAKEEIYLYTSKDILGSDGTRADAGPENAMTRPPEARAEKVPPADRQIQISDDTFLILSVGYEQYTLDNSLIAYGDSNNLYLPLDEISQALDFSIDVNSQQGSAKGWFVSEDRAFSLDLAKGEVISDGTRMTIPKGAVLANGNALYVDVKQLEKWFPVDFSFEFSNQSVLVNPRESLPFQERIEREQAWKNLKKSSSPGEARLPREKSAYQWISVPAMDIGMTSSYVDGSDSNDGLKTRFHILSKGDLGKMTSEIYLSGDDEDGLENTRITLRRDDPDGELLGPLKAKSVAVGDIRTTDVPIVGGGKTETGFSVSNKKLHRPREFDTTYFEGSLPPGWDVEVYRNSMLIDSARVGAEGKYQFNDVPVYYGRNDFELVFYGPQGQKRVETRRINVGNELLKKDSSEYDLSLSQKDTSLYDPENKTKTDEEGSLNFNATYDYGLSQNFSVGTGLSSREIDNKQHTYLNLGAKGSLEGIFLSSDYIHDTVGGDAVELFAQTGFEGLDLRFKQLFYHNFIDDRESRQTDPLESKTDLSISGLLKDVPFLPDLPFILSYEENRREDATYQAFRSRLSGNIDDIRLNNTLKWSETDSSTGSFSSVNGNFQASSQVGDLRIRGQLDYEIDPDTELDRAEISGFYNINDDLSSELILEKDMNNDQDVSGSLRFNLNNGKYILSPQVSYRSDGEISAMLSFSSSFGMKPGQKKVHASSTQLADKGSASVRVYHDKNNNQKFDQADEVIEGAVIKAPQSYREAKTNEDGIAFLDRLDKNKPTDIVLDQESLEDPFWAPSTPGRSIVPRPGHTQSMDIPVVTTGEIDGTVFTRTADSKKKPLSNALVQLVNEKGEVLRQVRSEYDGYYYFPKVFPGRYSVRIDPEDKRPVGKITEKRSVEIGSEGTVASGQDIFLGTKTLAAATDIKPGEKIPVPGKDVPPETGKAAGLKTGLEKMERRAGATLEPPRLQKSGDAATAFREKQQLRADFQKLKAEYDRLVTAGQTAEKQPVSQIAAAGQKTRSTAESSIGRPMFGIHLSSYRTPEKAALGIKYLMEKYKGLLDESDFTIKKIKISEEKGTWYRVIAGSFKERDQADRLAEKIKLSSPYCRVLPLEGASKAASRTGVHLTSTRTQENALASIENLKRRYPALLKRAEFTIKHVDLGPAMGRWYRVVAGKFENRADADKLARAIKMTSPYSRTMQIEKDNELGVHMASYRTLAKASQGLKLLQKKYASLLKDETISIRRTDLGREKGIWYRIIAGNFKDRAAAGPLKQTLNQMNQYAHILKF